MALYLAHRWRDYHDFNTNFHSALPQQCFVAPDGVTIIIPVVYDLARRLRRCCVANRKTPRYITDEYDKRTVKTQVDSKGCSRSGLSYFAQRGEFAISVNRCRKYVYIADGEIYVYNPEGRLTNNSPEDPRTSHLAFCFSSDLEKILFVTGHHSIS